ncbi:MAG TPA: fused MFS/spermidine synthase [Desulfatiglandales bacterium]|nr:fused MFS/spermidine synthase [Desulfatiglandales bacterium]
MNSSVHKPDRYKGKEGIHPLRAAGAGVLCAFFVSGACGLIHEVAWTRLLRLVMGNTTFSITTVLCAFMGGLALGSYLGGRIIDRRSDPLRVFAFLEGTIALYCFLLPWLIDGTQPVYRFLYQNTHTSFYVFSLIRFIFSGLLLLIPATFMGATLPVLSRFFVRSPERVGWSVGTLYGINTFGAVVGAAIAGFLLIPKLGVLRTIYLACFFNGMVCVTSYLIYRWSLKWYREADLTSDGKQPEPDRRTKKKKKISVEQAIDQRLTYGYGALAAVLIGYGFSGFAALVYEIAWTRTLSLLIGSTVYAFSMMLTAFVLGLAIGSMVYARFVDRVRDPMRALAVIEVAIGLSALIVVPFIDRLPFFVTGMISRFLESFWLLQLSEFGLILLIMLIPTILMGAAFPLVNRLYAQSSLRIGRSVGAVYGSNTIGTILGSFIGGFVLIPWIGIQNSIFVAVLLNILIGSLFFGFSRSLTPRRREMAALFSIAVVVVSIVFTPAWDASLMSFGPFHEAARITEATALSHRALEDMAGKSKVLFHKEGLSATITVKEISQGAITLYINGKPDASSFWDRPSQAMVAHIPLLLHPDPRKALVIGLASGITLGSAGLYPLESLECVEIEPAIVEACRYFDEYNYHILDDPRVNLIVADGRNHLALASSKYDVIMSQPSNPYFAGIADLFTREFFQLCSQRLTSQGIMCAWLQSYHIDLKSFRSIIRTFNSVFPNMTLWRVGKSDCLLIGSKGKLDVDINALTSRMGIERVALDLERIDINSPPDFFAHLIMGHDGVMRFSQGAILNTDDNAMLEFSAPHALTREAYQWELVKAIEEYRDIDLSFLSASEQDAKELLAIREQSENFINARGHVFQAHIYMNQGQQDEAIAEIRKAAALNQKDPLLKEFNSARHREAFYLAKGGKTRQAIDLYKDMLTVVPSDEQAHYNLAILLKNHGEFEESIKHFEEVLQIKPDYIEARYNLGEISERQGKVKEAVRHYRLAMQIDPDFIPALDSLARVLATHPDLASRDIEEAIRLAEKACELDNNKNPFLLETLSITYAAGGRFSDAIAAAEKALELSLSKKDNKLADRLRRRLNFYKDAASR